MTRRDFSPLACTIDLLTLGKRRGDSIKAGSKILFFPQPKLHE
jgi:hypothetical protein